MGALELHSLARRSSQQLALAVFALALACSGRRLFYVTSELPKLKDNPELELIIGPGPWPEVPPVFSDQDSVPDGLVLPTLKALMALPGAADACDAAGHPRPDAAEYCVALYKTPQDWRVTWPIRKLMEAHSSCKPPFGGIEDMSYGRGLPVFGYAHNHTCGLFASSTDLGRFPAMKSPEGIWVFVSYATSSNGEPALDLQGQLIPAWHWLATGHADNPRFYKWNAKGEVFRWSEDAKQWSFKAICKSQSSTLVSRQPLPPQCAPELTNWY
jgi:hypothetical protein